MGLRAIIMLVVGLGSTAYSLCRPYVGLLLLVLFYFVRPSLWGAEESIRYVEWITAGIFIGWLLHERTEAWHKGAAWLFLLLGLYTLSSIFAPFVYNETWNDIEIIAKIFVAVFLIIKLCTTPKRLAGLIWALLIGNIWFVKVVLLSWLGQGFSGEVRIDTAVGQGGGSNYIAWVLASTLPFLFYKVIKTNGWQRWMAAGLIPGWLASIVATGSRGGLLCAATSSFVFFLASKRKKGILIVMACGVLVLLVTTPLEYWERVSTITANPEEMDTSALSRYQNILAGIEIIKDYPLFGTGLHTFPIVKQNYLSTKYVGALSHVAHNTYIQMGSEVGVVFLVVFVFLTFRILWHLTRKTKAKTNMGEEHDIEWVRIGILSALAATLVQMIKGDMAKMDYFWWLYGIAFACQRIREYDGAMETNAGSKT